ncbi:MAG: phospholipase D family protein [Deltaproteobacteria bacterium]|nr:phospholipase D family protein [Deltaproteobacteria bacterium]
MKIEKCKILLVFVVCVFHFALLFAEGWAGMAVQACFSPKGRCSSLIVREIAQARSEILVAVYAFTSDELAWALIKAKQRGVKVQVVLDTEFDATNETSKGSLLEQQGIVVRRVAGLNTGNPERGPGLMHQKFAVIDRRAVLTGSYNWTVSADQFNEESLLIFRDAGPLAEDFRKEFIRLWEKKR